MPVGSMNKLIHILNICYTYTLGIVVYTSTHLRLYLMKTHRFSAIFSLMAHCRLLANALRARLARGAKPWGGPRICPPPLLGGALAGERALHADAEEIDSIMYGKNGETWDVPYGGKSPNGRSGENSPLREVLPTLLVAQAVDRQEATVVEPENT